MSNVEETSADSGSKVPRGSGTEAPQPLDPQQLAQGNELGYGVPPPAYSQRPEVEYPKYTPDLIKSKTPVKVECPQCMRHVSTRVTSGTSWTWWLIVFLILCFAIFIVMIVFLPIAVCFRPGGRFVKQKYTHQCPECSAKLAVVVD